MFNSLWLIHIYHASGESRTFYADGEYINDIIIKVWLYLYFLTHNIYNIPPLVENLPSHQ